MKYLKKFDTEAEVLMFVKPNVVLAEDTDAVLYNVSSNGVFIQHIDGRLLTTDQWAAGGYSSDLANGVAVCTAEVQFVIAKSDASESRPFWGGYGKRITDIVTTTSASDAILDYDGAGNTAKIIEQLSGYTDSKNVKGAPAAEACANFTFPNGANGYLPALGEWQVAYNNKTAVDSAMSLIGGTAIKAGAVKYWSSTQHNINCAWPQRWLDGLTEFDYKSGDYYVRAFSALSL